MLPADIPLPKGKKLYFASDFHLGVPNLGASHERERKICRWLSEVSKDAGYIFLLGDIFDFWFEYRTVVPRGFVRILGKLAELRDQGMPVVVFSGNHDIWMWDYLKLELDIDVIHRPRSFRCGAHHFHVGHGDGLGPGDYWYKAVKKVFRNPFFQWCYARLHPNLAVGLAQTLSMRSRLAGEKGPDSFFGDDEWIYQYCKVCHQETPHDFYVFGHRHLAMDLPVGKGGRYLNLGEWVYESPYAEYDGDNLVLKSFERELPALPSFPI